ncbi:MAG: carbohydrate kinase [Alphaproteobacteria bacterium]|nr:carbohydrate kinase [Alphaproteobacteria bacterium]
MSVVLGLDIGTTSTVGILIRLPDRAVATASRPVTLSSPHPGWAEEDPGQWWSNVGEIARELIGHVRPEDLRAIGVAGMLPAVVLLDEQGDLLRPSIQQSDGRCGAEVVALKRELDEKDFLKRAGNGINQQLVAPKLRWLAAHEPEVFRRIATVFGSYDYVNWKLTGIRAVEQNWALEAGFTDLANHAIADDLVALAGIARAVLPPRSVAHHVLGRVTAAAAKETGLPEGVPVVGGAADLIASALGAGVVTRGDVLLKFGGSVDVLIATDRAAPDPRLYLDYHLVPGLYMPNGCMATGGSGLNWFVDTFGGGRTHRALDVLAGRIPAGSEGAAILPYFLGEKTPIHDPEARGAFTGLTLAHGIGHLWRALLEAYAYAIRHHIEVLNEIGHPTERYLASDGGAASDVWMQIAADVLQTPIRRLSGHPGSCLGAAWTAAIGAGLTQDWMGVTRFVSTGALVLPNAANAEVYREGYARFRDLYRRLAS